MHTNRPIKSVLLLLCFLLFFVGQSALAGGEAVASQGGSTAIWFWPLSLFVFTFFLGILAVLAGVGGGVLFVPLVSAFFPFHLDFVRGTGLFVALACALAAGPRLLRNNLANLRLALPFAFVASIFSIIGALIGLSLPTSVVQICLGCLILFVSGLLIFSRDVERPEVTEQDALGGLLGIGSSYIEETSGEEVKWQTHRTPQGFLLFAFIGLAGGMFGLGAGWANVPALNILLGAPIKVAVGSSVFLISITGTSASWIYLNKGCLIPLMTVPSILGLMLGAKVGVKIFEKTHPKIIRYVVIAVLIFAGGKALAKGLGWG